MSVTLKDYSSLEISGINLTSVQRRKKNEVFHKVFDKMVLNKEKMRLQTVLKLVCGGLSARYSLFVNKTKQRRR